MWQLWVIICTVIWFWPNTQQWTGVDFQFNFNFQPPELFDNFTEGLLANRLLSQADKIFVGEIVGPECFAQSNGKTYASIADGRIIELLSDTYRTVVHLSPNGLSLNECQQIRNTGKCSRPLGIKFDSKGILYAVDPYFGLHQVNVDSGESKLILDITKIKVNDGSNALFLDDLEIIERQGKKHLFYLSDASQKWLLYDVGNAVSEADNTGRLLTFDMEKNELNVLIPDVYFPNGLQLTDDKKSLIICIFSERKLVKYDLQTGKITDFAYLPGEPDNIKRSRNPKEETYWVGFFEGRNKYNPNFALDTVFHYGGLKRFGFRMFRLIGSLIGAIGKQLNLSEIENMGFFIKIGGPFFKEVCKYGLAVEVNSEGKIINSLHSPDGSICSLSEAFEYENDENNRKFYLGSFSNNYLGSLSLSKASFRSTLSSSSSSSQSKMTQGQKTKPTSSQQNQQNTQNSQNKPKTSTNKQQQQQTQQQNKRHQEL